MTPQDQPRHTPLHATHVRLGARMAPFGGWDMPIQYAGILAEHEQTRRRASLFDTCHMGEFHFTGASAGADLDQLVTQPVQTLAIGQCRYGYLLDDAGGVQDDLIVYRLGDEHYLAVVNAGTCAGDAAWMSARLSDGTTFDDASARTAKLDIQGPEAHAALETACGVALPRLGYFRCVDVELLGVPVLLSRTGYTGELGYELYLPAEQAVMFWGRLTAVPSVAPAGLGARDTLRLEMGYPLYGHELSLDRSPVGAARPAFIGSDKEFIGSDRVRREQAAGPAELLVGLRMETRRAAREGDQVRFADTAVGTVTSGSLSPSLGTAVALAYVAAEHAVTGTALDVVVRNKPQAAKVVELPFYTEGTARRKLSE